MNLVELLSLYQQDERTKKIIDKMGSPPPARLYLKGLVGSIDTFIAAATYKSKRGSHLFILPDKEDAIFFQNDLTNILGKKEALLFPSSYKRPGHSEDIDKNHILLRIKAISKIQSRNTRGELLVTYPEALFEKVVNAMNLDKTMTTYKTGQKIDFDKIIDSLIDQEFERTDFVFEPGQFSIRGGIIDIFSYGNDHPYRIELLGNEIESIRTFDILQQLSLRKVEQITIIPNLQTSHKNEEKVSLLEILPSDTVIWIKDVPLSLEMIQKCYNKAEEIYNTGFDEPDNEVHLSYFSENPNINFICSDHFELKLKSFFVIETGSRNYYNPDITIEYDISPQTSFNKNFDLLINNYKENQKKGIRNILFADNAKQIERFYNIFEDIGTDVTFYPFPIAISKGFLDKQLKVACYTDHQIFDRYHKYQYKSGFAKNQALLMKSLQELTPGDYITHIDHGIGRFSGLEKIKIKDTYQEMVRLVYKNNDLLYVSINALYKIAKYVGKEGKEPRIDKLGSGSWENLKRRAKKKIKDIAKDLIKLYAKRKAQKGWAYNPDSYLQHELEASFIYEDTPDQLKATQSVKKDMESNYPMDMLICGDVGFGKTEIAIRAAAKAVAENKQVAVLVPTTILALQHYNTFSERLKDFPCSVDYLNRFKTAKQKRETEEKIKSGDLDIIISTHALLGKRIAFKDLGLLIIDEEQKFGVSAKEKLKQIKVNIDTLTLTATPIPRTLQFSLMGARDLSVINTPPPNRQPIHTETHIENNDIISEAIYHEVNRGGQVYYVHNRVKDINAKADMLQGLCPDLKIKVAHGQMGGTLLEDTMHEFIDGKFEILICTSIIESGLDISNVNTIIINNGHQFGLSDLHQLRGRVGRSNKQAYCYIITPPVSTLNSDARKRLKTIEEYAGLGDGFNIAMRDLDIRGAGNLLGSEQSGFIAEIGYEMYQKILDEAIQELKEHEFKDITSTQFQGDSFPEDLIKRCHLDTDIEILIPDDYVSNIQERLHLYTELNTIEHEETLLAFEKKLSDRFGPVPLSVKELMNAVRVQWLAKKCCFTQLILKNNALKCCFIENQESPYFQSEVFTNLLKFVQYNSDKCRLKEINNRLFLIFNNVTTSEEAKAVLKQLIKEIIPES